MKKIFMTVFMSAIISAAWAAPTPEQLMHQEIVDLSGMKKDLIFQKSLEWISTTFGSGKSVLDYSDKESGKIVGNIFTHFTIVIAKVNVKVKMTIDIKDGKARLTYSPSTIVYEDIERDIRSGEVDDVKESFKPITNSYMDFMLKQKSNNDNW